jgi:hypothetical protein
LKAIKKAVEARKCNVLMTKGILLTGLMLCWIRINRLRISMRPLSGEALIGFNHIKPCAYHQKQDKDQAQEIHINIGTSMYLKRW